MNILGKYTLGIISQNLVDFGEYLFIKYNRIFINYTLTFNLQTNVLQGKTTSSTKNISIKEFLFSLKDDNELLKKVAELFIRYDNTKSTICQEYVRNKICQEYARNKICQILDEKLKIFKRPEKRKFQQLTQTRKKIDVDSFKVSKCQNYS